MINESMHPPLLLFSVPGGSSVRAVSEVDTGLDRGTGLAGLALLRGKA